MKNTELEQVQRKLEETEAALVQSEKMASLGNLIVGVAHEINTPVGSIHSNGDLMVRALEKLRTLLKDARGLSDESELSRILDTLDDIGQVNQTACQRIVTIVRSLKKFARLEERECRHADIHEEIESTLTLVHHELKNRIGVVRDFGDLPAVECFPSHLNQVFLNLLVNASQAIEGTGEIRVTTRSLGDEVQIAFADNGCGIPAEDLGKIFETGFTTKGAGIGTGLGLDICCRIVRAHSGRIEVESELGRGTTFTVTLPVVAPESPES